MTAFAKIETRSTLAQEAQRIVEAGMVRKGWSHAYHQDIKVDAAQTYLDNLQDGYDDPTELLEAIAAELADDELPQGAMHRDGSYAEGPYDSDEWFDMNREHYMARAAESYVPAGGAA